jgi:large subunit ribosomal protein L9
MAKQLILMSDVDGLGIVGDEVKVADGYARNYLLPKNLAAPVSEKMKERLAEKRIEREAELAKELEQAKTLQGTVEETSLTIAVRTSSEGKLYGSIKTAEIVKAAAEQGLELDKQQVIIDSPIRELGVFTVQVRLHPEVLAELKVWVVEE